MAAAEVVLRGAVTADGRLVLEGEPGLPPGCVEVILRPIEGVATPVRPQFETLRRIWADQEARGTRGRTLEEAVADVRALRDEWEPGQRELG